MAETKKAFTHRTILPGVFKNESIENCTGKVQLDQSAWIQIGAPE
jgi:hypothetical protein